MSHITITGGTETNYRDLPGNNLAVAVPKRDLVQAAVAQLDSGRLHWLLNDSPAVDLLEAELQSFQPSYSKAGNELFEAERKEHDDLVLALAMGVWLAR